MAKTDLIVTSQFIMRLFGLSQPGLSRLCAAGAPRAGRNAYDVRLFLGWWLDNIYSELGREALERRENTNMAAFLS